MKPTLTVSGHQSGATAAFKRTLGSLDLVAIGIGGIIGAGVFTLTGVVAGTYAGPALVISFILASAGCALAGLCYSEFAAMMPVGGSAYSYAFAAFGELPAWIIGWDLILEYCVGAATVAIGWSQTLRALMDGFGLELPRSDIFNWPALLIVALVSFVLIRGIRESASLNALTVILKVTILIVFIVVGWAYMQPSNHTPLIPANEGTFGRFGWSGIVSGAGVIFFAYIGFDAVSTAAQESKNPGRDLPIGILGSLGICTALFILYAWVLTGIVNYRELNVAAPLSLALAKLPFPWLAILMNLAVLAGLTSVVLVMLLGQSRVFHSMARDGLLPEMFGELHPRYNTPWRCNILLMLFVGCFASFSSIGFVGAMTSIGTLFAFTLVCAGVIVMRRRDAGRPRPFRTPWVPVVPALGVIVNLLLMFGLGVGNWVRLLGWLAIGLILYFGRKRMASRLSQQS